MIRCGAGPIKESAVMRSGVAVGSVAARYFTSWTLVDPLRICLGGVKRMIADPFQGEGRKGLRVPRNWSISHTQKLSLA